MSSSCKCCATADYLKIDRQLNTIDVTESEQLMVVDDGFVASNDGVATSPRIGVAYAGADALLPWRYLLTGSAFVSGGQVRPAGHLH